MHAVTSTSDSVLRSMTDDSAFRVITIRSTELVRGALKAQNASGPTAKFLADLCTGATLLRETMSPSLRVQVLLRPREGAGYLLGDSHPSGQTRGLVAHKAKEPFPREDIVLQVVRSLQDGRIQQGVVAVPDNASVSQALMAYMQESEQITTMIAVSSVFQGDELVAAGGYLVQLLPGAPYGTLAIMTERLADFEQIDPLISSPTFTPEQLCGELLYGMPHTLLGGGGVEYGCWCSRPSVLGALASISREDLQSMVDDGEVLEINCDYCAKEYQVSPSELKGLLSPN
jgi:molecular chaperone Hsp33